MHPDKAEILACDLFGNRLGWQSKLADLLDVNRQTVLKWLKAGEIPTWASVILESAQTAHKMLPEWVNGNGFRGSGEYCEYLIHNRFPRFVARQIVREVDGGFDEDLNASVQGLVYKLPNFLLCEIHWQDKATEAEMEATLVHAGEAIDRFERQTDQIDAEILENGLY